LEPSLFEAQVAQARASLARLQADAQRSALQLEDAQQKLKRARELAAQQLIAATDLEAAEMSAREAESAVKSAEAQIAQARASLNQNEVNLAHTVIAAPIDGIVISRNVDVGQTVAASMQAPTLFVIARDLKQMQVNASVSESDIGRIRTGETVTFRVDAYPTDVFSGTVSQVRLQPVVEQNVVSYLTVIDVPNSDLRLKPGMTANVTIETARASDVLLVPNAALRVRPTADVLAALGQGAAEANATPTSGSKTGVIARPADKAGHAGRPAGQLWVQVDGRLAPVPVRVGITDGKQTAVFSDALVEGAVVVSSIVTDSAPNAASTSPLLPAFRGRGGGTRPGGARPPGA
jgi:HlyD family secretion protein